MEEQISFDAGAGKREPGRDEEKDPKAHAFKEFEELISPEENVEYEEDAAFQAIKSAGTFEERRAVGLGETAQRPSGTRKNKRVSIPLRIKFPDGASEEYFLNLSISLQRAKNTGDSFYAAGISLESLKHEEDQEIDLLDGRTTLILDEEEELEEAGEPIHEERQRSWIARIFHAWRKRGEE